MDLREIFNNDMCRILGIYEKSLYAKFKADKVMIDLLNMELEKSPDTIKILNEIVPAYQKYLRKSRLRDWILKDQPFSVINLSFSVIAKIILLPVFLIGFLNCIIPYWLTASRVANIKDQQFHSSFKYVTGMIIFPVWSLVVAGILAFLSFPLWMIIIYILLLPLTGLAAFKYYICFRKLLGKMRFTFRKNSDGMRSLLEKRKQIIALMMDIVNRQLKSYENPR
jgi:hypothetical protein